MGRSAKLHKRVVGTNIPILLPTSSIILPEKDGFKRFRRADTQSLHRTPCRPEGRKRETKGWAEGQGADAETD